MSPSDLATRQDIAALSAKFDQVLAALAKPAAPAPEPLVTLDEAAAHTKFDPRTVRDWVVAGRFGADGKRVYLSAYEYRNGQLRFKLSEVEAFGLNIGVLTPSLVAGQPPVAAKAARPSKPKRAPLDSKQALKVA